MTTNYDDMPRTPPAAPDAERAVIGSCLLNREAVVAVAPWLDPADFYDERARAVYAAILACYGRREPPDTRTVAAELTERGQLDRVGGLAYLAACLDGVPTSYHVAYYGQPIARAAARRRLIDAGERITALGYAVAADVDAAIAEAHAILTAATRRTAVGTLRHVREPINALEHALEHGDAPGIPTGFLDLDRMTGGLHPGDFVVVAGRPGTGKTAFALEVARRIVAGDRDRPGLPVLLFSQEMTAVQCVQRLAAAESGVPLADIRDRTLEGQMAQRVVGAFGRLTSLPLYVDETPAQLIHQIAAKVQQAIAELGPVPLVIIDYIQLCQAGGRVRSDEERVALISQECKALAKRAGLTVLGLAQMNRAVEARADREPQMSDLRGSGAIEQDADLIGFLHRPERYDPDTPERGVAQLIVKKHRNGEEGTLRFRFDAPTCRFDDLAYQTMDGYR